MPTAAQLATVRMLIASAPDAVLNSMAMALTGAEGELAPILAQVDQERENRRLRDIVLGPVVPLFAPRRDGVRATTFPRRLLPALWRAVIEADPEMVTQAAADVLYWHPQEDEPPRSLDDLCRAAARLVRHDPPAAFQGPEAAELGVYLSLGPLARRALRRLPDWLGKATDERAAILRLIFKDAAAVCDDSAPRMMEMLLGHLPEAYLILRPISVLTERASDRYLADSELADFGERLLTEVDVRVDRLKHFDPNGGEAAARAIAADVHAANAILTEFEHSVELSKDGPWGRRVGDARKAMAVLIEARLRESQRRVEAALPLGAVRLTGRMTRPAPRISTPPEPRLVEPARALLVLLSETRHAAATGGFGALRAHVAEGLSEFLEIYADELVHLLNAGEAPDTAIAHAYLDLAAEFLGWAENTKAAQIVRRRAAVAGAGTPSQEVA